MTTATSPIEALFRRIRFLVVDGSTGRVDTIERYLLLTGAFVVRRAATPLLALRILQDKRTPSDCIICQNDMWPMSGIEFLANLRAGRYGGHPICDTKFILLSRQPIGHLADFNHLRLDGLLAGGFDRDQLCEAVFKALSAPAPACAAPSATAGAPLVLQPTGGAPMPHLNVAHVREQGVDLVIVLLDTDLGRQSPDAQLAKLEALRAAAAEARLGGEVVPVWDIGDGRMGFIAPPGYHPYFKSISLDLVRANLNRTLILDAVDHGPRLRSA
jgi:CheY-like chemotaxis protein